MKNLIGEKRYEEVQHALYLYLKTNESFNDKTLLKAIQINCIKADNEITPSDVYVRQSENLVDKLRKSGEKLSELACLLIFLNNEDYEQVAYTMHDKIDFSSIEDTELLEKLELIRRFIRLLYLHIDDKLIPTLENLMQILPQNVDASKILWEHYNFWFDTNERDYELLIEMSLIVIKYRNELNPRYFLAHLYNEMEEYQKAIDTYYVCLDLCEKNPSLSENIAWLYFHLANSSFSQHKYEETIEFIFTSLSKYKEFNPDKRLDKAFFPLVMNIRANSYIKLNRIELAYRDIEEGLKYNADNIELLNLKEEIENI